MNFTRRPIAFPALIFLFTLIIMPLGLKAEENKTSDRAPIQIEANHMMSDKKHNSVFFSGKVEAKQGDVVIHADEMTVYYNQEENLSKNSSNKSQSIDRLKAVGNVEITKDAWVATGDNAEYFEDEQKVILTGHTKVWQNNSLVTGEKFILYLDEGKSIVERSTKNNERVKAFFYPESDN